MISRARDTPPRLPSSSSSSSTCNTSNPRRPNLTSSWHSSTTVARTRRICSSGPRTSSWSPGSWVGPHSFGLVVSFFSFFIVVAPLSCCVASSLVCLDGFMCGWISVFCNHFLRGSRPTVKRKSSAVLVDSVCRSIVSAIFAGECFVFPVFVFSVLGCPCSIPSAAYPSLCMCLVGKQLSLFNPCATNVSSLSAIAFTQITA